jgi:selenoprotein W-related protein
LTAKLLHTFKQKIKGCTLIPASGGCFELTINGELVYSKLATGRFPDEKAILDTVASLSKK